MDDYRDRLPLVIGCLCAMGVVLSILDKNYASAIWAFNCGLLAVTAH